MPKCAECRYEGSYTTEYGGHMECQAPGGGPTYQSGEKKPISRREAALEYPCDFFQPKEKPLRAAARQRPLTQGGASSLLSRIFGGKQHPGVKFKEKAVKGRNTYEVYTAKTKDEALEFLRGKSVSKKLHYIVVETPEGKWGLDIDGIYEEK